MRKKTLAFLSALVTLSCCLAGCGGGDEYNREKFYGVVRFSEESNGLVVYIPNLGDVVIPETEECRSCFNGEGNDGETYRLKAGDLIVITFRYEKSRDDGGVRIMETYPARFDGKARLIEALEENISFGKTDDGYTLSFPLAPETESAEIGDALYFRLHGGENGSSWQRLYATGLITGKADGIITVSLTIPEDGAEFLKYFHEMTVEREWTD